MRLALAPIVAAIAVVLPGCTSSGRPVDLLRPESGLLEASVAGRDLAWTRGQTGKGVRIDDVVHRTLPASPPSRLRFRLDVPKRARLAFACGIAPDRQDRPGVEFVVKARRGRREDTLFSHLLDPIRRPAHRRWVPFEVDLSRVAGQGVELTLETRGFEEGDDSRRAFWGSPALVVPDHQAPLVVLYLVDTLRADHTSPYGYARDTTPELSAFARDSVLFETAVAHASWTKPSVASILTSLLPGQHRAVQLRDPLDSGQVTLPEMLQVKGYATGAAIANSVIYSEGANFDQGFDCFAGLHGAGNRPSKLVEAGVVVDTALGWLDSRRGLAAFLYVHTMDPHVPYAPPPPFDRKYEPYPTPEHPAVDPRSDYKEPLDRDRMIAQYDGDVAYGDQEFGRFVRELRKRGLYERALIVFMADHGEEFLDHGQFLHGKSVFDELIRIPLIVKFPGRRDAGRRLTQQVQAADVLPTILENEGLPVPRPPVIAGRPLQSVIRGGAPEPPAVSEISHRGYVAHGMRTVRDKYVQTFSPEVREMYFDLVRDPHELQNRIEDSPDRVRLLRAGVEAAMVPNPFRNALRVSGGGQYDLKLRTGGWIEGVQATGLGSGERYEVEGNGRKLALVLRPRPGHPRAIDFSVRPMGAPVWLEGTRDGHPLRTSDVRIAEEGVRPPAVPVRLPEIEPQGDEGDDPSRNVFTPPPAEEPGVQLWLILTPGRKVMTLDRDACERLRALGYIGGNCGGAGH